MWKLVWLSTLGCIASLAHGESAIRISTSPESPLIEETDFSQRLNFDFVLENKGEAKVEIRSLEISVYDARDALVLRRDVDGSGAAPAIDLLRPDRELAPRARGRIFNPFVEFARTIDAARLQYRFEFATPDGAVSVAEASVRPRKFAGAAHLKLPMRGLLWVKHGHDFLSHHRRWNPEHPVAIRSFGPTGNFERYALDLMQVNGEGKVRKGASNANDDYFGWNAPVYAPAAGTIVALHDADEDDDIASGKTGFDPDRLPQEPMHFYGNYVVISHGDGEFSVLGHLRRGSVSVQTGQRVAAGQLVARIGASGSAEFEPHLHYELRTGPGMKGVEGLPAYFHDFTRLLGAKRAHVQRGPVDSGDLLESR